MALAEAPSDLTVEMPLDSWRQFPDGQRLGAELRRLADADAEGRGRRIKALVGVQSDKARGVYVATFTLEPT